MKYPFLLCTLAACTATAFAGDKHQPSDTSKAVQVTMDTLEVSAKAGKPPYQPSATHTWEIRNTRVALTFNMKEKTANVKEWIKMHPFFYGADTISLDAKSMQIDSVEDAGKKNTPLPYTYANDKLVIRLPHTYKQGDSLTLYLKYKAMPYAETTGGSSAITEDRGLYFINTDGSIPHKHSQIWTQGETEANSHWMITFDKPNTRFTTQIELTVPDSFVTLSNGVLVKQTKTGKDMRTDIWREDMPIQAYAVMFAAGKFSIIKDKWKTKEVSYYVEPEYAPYASLMFNHTPEMIDHFSTITGVQYPWNKYNQVVVRDYVSGAMENTTASLFGEFMNENKREIADHDNEDIVSHELFHQWFGDYVTCESWSNLTVNESFANYGEQLWRRYKYGKASSDELAWSDLQLYIYSSSMNDPQLVRFNYDNREEMFDAISYNKGGAILHYLNVLMGDDAFNRAMNIYLTKNALHSAEAHNWRMAVEEATGQDWNWFFNEWYFHAGHPNLKINYDYQDSANRLVVSITQTQKDSTFDYTLPLKTAVIYGDHKTIVDWNVTKRKDTLIYAYKNGMKPAIVPDVEHVMPGDLHDNKKIAQWLAAYNNCDDYITRRLAIGAASKQLSDSSAQAIMQMAFSDSLYLTRRYALGTLTKVQSDKYRKKWLQNIKDATRDNNIHVRAEAFSVLAEWKEKSVKAIDIEAIADSSYSVAGEALSGLNEIDADTAYVLARKIVQQDPKSTLKSEAWTIVGKKAADGDVSLYETYTPYMLGNQKYTIAMSLESYLKHVESDESFDRGLGVYVTMIRNESAKSLKPALAGFLFQLAKEEKSNTTDDDKSKAAKAEKRLGAMKLALQKMTDDEQDVTIKDDLKKMMKNTFDKA